MNWNWYRFLQTLEAIAALFIVVGLLTLGAGVVEYRASQAMGAWPATDGHIISTDIVSTEKRGRMVYFIDAAVITYGYQVEGAIYLNDRVGPDAQPVAADSAEGRRLLASYRPGEAVTVFYNPDDPAQSVLEREPQLQALRAGGLILGLGLAVLGLRGLLRKRPYQSSEE